MRRLVFIGVVADFDVLLEGFGILCGLPTGTRTPIDRLGGDCSILLSYRETAQDSSG